jgi:hypothetical protein
MQLFFFDELIIMGRREVYFLFFLSPTNTQNTSTLNAICSQKESTHLPNYQKKIFQVSKTNAYKVLQIFFV